MEKQVPQSVTAKFLVSHCKSHHSAPHLEKIDVKAREPFVEEARMAVINVGGCEFFGVTCWLK